MLHTYLLAFGQWLHLHPHYAGLTTFAIACVESIAFIGCIIPGSVVMTAIGGLIGLGIIPIWSTLLWAILGAVVGDGFSFFLGYHYQEHLRDIWLFRRYPRLLHKGEAFFARHGGKSIFFARFVGPLRAFVPIIAGMLRLPVRRYIIINICSACLWAPVYLLPGFIVGIASQALSGKVALRDFLWLFGGVILLWLLIRLSCQLPHVFGRIMDKMYHRLPPHWQQRLTHNDASLKPYQQLSTLVMFIVSACAFALVAYSVKHHGWITAFNQSLSLALYHLQYPWLNQSFTIIAHLADGSTLAGMAFIVLLLLAWRRYWIHASYWIVANVSTVLLVEGFKHGIANARPTLLISRHGYSFPSWHTTASLVLIGLLAVFLARRTPSKRLLYYRLTAGFVCIIALSRLYIGVHWLSDIVGAILLGYSLLALLIFAFRYTESHHSDADSSMDSRLRGNDDIVAQK